MNISIKFKKIRKRGLTVSKAIAVINLKLGKRLKSDFHFPYLLFFPKKRKSMYNKELN